MNLKAPRCFLYFDDEGNVKRHFSTLDYIMIDNLVKNFHDLDFIHANLTKDITLRIYGRQWTFFKMFFKCTDLLSAVADCI